MLPLTVTDLKQLLKLYLLIKKSIYVRAMFQIKHLREEVQVNFCLLLNRLKCFIKYVCTCISLSFLSLEFVIIYL